MEQQSVPLKAIERALHELEALALTLIELEPRLRSVLGFRETVEHRGIEFYVGERFVIANLRPLAFLALVEEVDQDVSQAIVRLYDRVTPLLLCQHEWTTPDHWEIDSLADIGGSLTNVVMHPPRVCKLCTAFALSGELPRVGRNLEDKRAL